MHELHKITIKETPTHYYPLLLKPPCAPARHPHHMPVFPSEATTALNCALNLPLLFLKK